LREEQTDNALDRAIGDAIDIYKMMINEKEMSTCACTPEHPCTREENRCLNFVMGYECDEHNCAVGKTVCENRPFAELEERHDRGNEYDIGVEIMETKDKGYGIRSMRTFKPGQIILEYTGEIITQEECNRRMHKEYKNNKVRDRKILQCALKLTTDSAVLLSHELRPEVDR
jgi:[histone H3]-lysine4 N-trimethyltransferase ASH1L